ncbi:hypothetical protein M433DRAFT_140442 [Acidomyces richmondensis BFW]|nr:hypothetical protein M433DRAFT_140442 [Acidomyces richmondensis BFW]
MSPSPPTIGTHNGHFHADEALAVYLLRLLPEYTDASLIRTRDPSLLAPCTVVVDVGGVHDHAIHRYDHHQREFHTTFPGRPTKLSSAGLVWLHHGRRIVELVTGRETEVELLWRKMYEDFIEAFDANDNGIAVCDPVALRAAGIERRFADRGFTLASVVNRYNHGLPPSLLVKKPEDFTSGENEEEQPTQAEEDRRFLAASTFVGEQFLMELQDKTRSWLPARNLVQDAFASRTQYDAKGRIIVIPYRKDGVPWMDHLYALESEHGVEGQVLYALFAENGEADSKWRIRAVSLEAGGFENRKGLPEAWRGLREEELSRVSEVPDCVFVHAGGFIGGNRTFKGALEMARRAVEM